MPSLEELKSKFPVETIQPFGQVCIVPLKSLGNDVDEKLRKQGHEIYYQAWHGTSCAFVSLEVKPQKKVELEDPSESSQKPPTTPSAEKQHTPPQFWTQEEVGKLKIYYAQGKPAVEIALLLGHSTKSTLGRIGHEIKTGHLVKHEQTPAASTRTTPSPPTENPMESSEERVDKSTISPETSTNQQPSFNELLNACSVLYPAHLKVVSELLKQAKKIVENEATP